MFLEIGRIFISHPMHREPVELFKPPFREIHTDLKDLCIILYTNHGIIQCKLHLERC